MLGSHGNIEEQGFCVVVFSWLKRCYVQIGYAKCIQAYSMRTIIIKLVRSHILNFAIIMSGVVNIKNS